MATIKWEKEPRVVYIIFVGEYSDRSEVAAFLTREEAEEFCKIFERGNSWDKAQIVEMTGRLALSTSNRC